MRKLKKALKSWKVWLLIIFVALSIVSINPRLNTKGAMIERVEPDSTAEVNGIEAGEIIKSINGNTIKDREDFTETVTQLEGEIVSVKTNKGSYSLVHSENKSLGMVVGDVPQSNIEKGLDLAGGVRVLLSPKEEISSKDMESAVQVTKKRLNVFGLADVTVRQTSDFSGNQYILIEASGASRQKIKELAAKEGNFEAKISNETVFVGGEDIKDVCRSSKCSGINAQKGCNQVQDQWVCQFQFRVDVSPESAEKHARITEDLKTVRENNQEYLNETLDLYLDGELIDSLRISADLKGQKSTSFVIQGPGKGKTKKAATNKALEEMKKLQTVLITGSLPTEFQIESMHSVSPVLGEDFFQSALITILIAVLAVSGVAYAKFRKPSITVLVVTTMLSEVIIILGIAALIGWNLDLAAIAGIIATIGTGVDAQIILTDETLHSERKLSWKERVKRAFSIILGAYFTTVVAMIPLYSMGAGIVRGFAVVTIIGVTVGVFITRPAYGKLIEILHG